MINHHASLRGLFVVFSIVAALVTLYSCDKEDPLPPPVITGFTPTEGIHGAQVTITGVDFDSKASGNIVKFNGTLATVTASITTSITTTVPSGATTGKITVAVGSNTATSEMDFIIFQTPTISDFNPANGLPGTSLTITGTNFSNTLAGNIVKVGELAATVTVATATSLTIIIPANATSSKITVTVDGLTATSSNDLIITPVITGFDPASATIGGTVTITGTNFGSTTSTNLVKFNGTDAAVTAASSTSISAIVPALAESGKITVTVSGVTATSSSDFTVIPSITSVVPAGGPVGTEFTISGTGFSSEISSNTIKINNVSMTVLMATKTSLKARVIEGATSGSVSVTVGTNTAIGDVPFDVFVEAVIAGGAEYDEAYTIAVDQGGNTIIGGRFEGTATFGSTNVMSAGKTDIFIAKYNPSFEVEWVKRAGGSETDQINSVTTDANRNIYVCGTVSGTADFSGTTVSGIASDIVLAKYNPSGDLIWVKKGVGEAGTITISGWSTRVNSMGTIVYMTGWVSGTTTFGTTVLTAAGETDFFLAAFNTSNGDIIWTKKLGTPTYESGHAMALDPADNIYVTGAFYGTLSLGSTTLTAAATYDAFIAKFDDAGEPIWIKQLAGANDFDLLLGVAVDGSGACYVTGYTSGNAMLGTTNLPSLGNEDIVVAKLSQANGDVIWAKTIGGSDNDNGRAIVIDEAGNSYVTGYFSRTVNFGTTSMTSNANGRDVFVTKLSAAGEVQWAKTLGSPENDSGEGIALDPTGKVYTTGYYQGPATIGLMAVPDAGPLSNIFIWRMMP